MNAHFVSRFPLSKRLRLPLDLGRRSNAPEWLDGSDLDSAELEKVLRDLATFNRTFLGHFPLLRWLGRVLKAAPDGNALTLVDVGCGYGDLLRAIRAWSRRRGYDLNLIGIDVNPETVRIAQAATDPADRIDFRVMNIFELGSTANIDLVVSSLVTHHLPDREIILFLRLMDRISRLGWAICDLQRSHFLYHFIGFCGRVAGFHPMVAHDGQISVTRSLTRAEWKKRIAEAGLSPAKASIHWFLFRFLIARPR